MATAPGAYAAQPSTEIATRAPDQSPENIVVAEAGMGIDDMIALSAYTASLEP
jgi:hypothetical protein